MNDFDVIAIWLVQRGLAGAGEVELLEGFCERCAEIGLTLSRGMAIIDTLHPIYEGRVFRWRNDGVEESQVVEYGRTTEGEAAANWQKSVFHHLLTTGRDEYRVGLGRGGEIAFPALKTIEAEGYTDYLAFVHRFAREGSIGDMDCVYSCWMTRHADGFGDGHLTVLRHLVPLLALAIKCASLARIAETLVGVYLGQDAGQRVLAGRIHRGVADRISAVLWFSDLRGYTTISDTASPDEIIPLLNDYAEAVISAIGEVGGDVLKLMGDGILAIFKAEDQAKACRRALQAHAGLGTRLTALNGRRTAEGRPTTTVYLGLHIGDVFYGNIGSNERLDFTVVGPAVNEVSRIASMCRSVDRDLVMSAAFREAMSDDQADELVSLGRYALRGVGRAQELFTLDPGRHRLD